MGTPDPTPQAADPSDGWGAEVPSWPTVAPGERVVFLVDASSRLEGRMLRRWIEASRPEDFAAERIDPREIDSIEALQAIPPLEKETLRERPEAFRAPDAEARTYATQVTSGSTGTPLALAVDRLTYQLAMALLTHYDVADLTIIEPEIGEVIERIMTTRERPA